MAGRFSIEAIFSGNDQVSKVLSRIEGRTGKFGAGLKRDFAGLGKNFSQVTDGIASIAQKAAIAGGALAGLAGAGILAAVQSSNALGDSLGKVASIIEPMSGTVADATARMKSDAISWSKVHTDTAKSFIDTSYQMLSAGLNEVQAHAATKAAMLTATAAMGDATQAGQLLATLYNNLGNKTKDAGVEFGRLGDIVTQTQAVFQFANFDALNEGLKYAVPAMLQYGVSLTQTTTALGLLNNAGLQGSQAGTAWAATMSKMIKASSALGFTIAKTADGGVDFNATLHNMHKVLGPIAKMTDGMKLRLQKAFGEEGVRSVALLIDKADEFSTSLAKVNDNAGVAARATAVIEAAGSGPFKIMMNRWVAAKVAMGDALTPVLSPIIEGIGKVVDSIGDWVGANKGLISGGIQQAIATAMPIVRAFGDSFIAALPAIKSVVGMLFSGFGSGAHWIEVAKEGASILGKLAAGAIALAAVFGGALAAGFEVAVDLCNDVIGAWNSMINGIGRVLFAFDDFFSNLGAKWRAFSFQALADYLIDGLVNGIKSGAYKVAEVVTNLGQTALDALKSIWDSHSPAVKFTVQGGNAADGVVLGLKKGIPGAVRASQEMADRVLGAMALPAPALDANGLFGTTAASPFAKWTLDSMAPQLNAPSLGNDRYTASVPQLSSNAQPEVVGPAERGANDDARLERMLQRLLQSGGGGGVITVRAEKGSSADVSEQPKGGLTLKMEKSGGF
jgi:TP901 family phage tail tape measure protein